MAAGIVRTTGAGATGPMWVVAAGGMVGGGTENGATGTAGAGAEYTVGTGGTSATGVGYTVGLSGGGAWYAVGSTGAGAGYASGTINTVGVGTASAAECLLGTSSEFLLHQQSPNHVD
ncbi:glycine-rich cell wall structural protein 1.8-like [Zingiber officinale]|uniref:glycine-rich cell wall structural protein 1.8-like n=1 Tax=Zingiber officinale TaxID=94328 RepID=UPI001C4AE478|nr:glycine-rich cell wall structural protein 1.8-like [Zingiber officinale]